MSRLTWNMVKNDPFPKLSAKAMEIRWLIAPVAEILRPWVGNAIVAWLHELLELSKGMDDLVFGNKTFRLTPEEARALGAATFAFNATLSKLAWHFHQRGQPFCNFTIKNHYLLHIGLHACQTGINPRLAFCYQGEDFMSLVKSLCISSSRGVDSAQADQQSHWKILEGTWFVDEPLWADEKMVAALICVMLCATPSCEEIHGKWPKHCPETPCQVLSCQGLRVSTQV